MIIGISIGSCRKSKNWYYEEWTLEDFIKRISSPTVKDYTIKEYRGLSREEQSEIKDVGGFVLGKLKDNKRRKDSVLYRSCLSLDMDYATQDTISNLESNFPYTTYIYSTFNHTPQKPRYRLIIPLSRNISPDEYSAVSRMIAKEINIELFDDTTYDPSRLMYWPAICIDGEFVFKEIKKAILNPDIILSKYTNWKDCNEWPTSSRVDKIHSNHMKKQADPLTKRGIVGAFCKTYYISDVMEKFLSDVYEKSDKENRYNYIKATSQAGVVVYDDKFAYSHHSTDPACDKLLNAFDLVRIHKCSSFKEMEKLALSDEKVKMALAKERREIAKREFNVVDNNEDSSWQSNLELDQYGNTKATLDNISMIVKNDSNLQNIVYNEFKHCLDVVGKLPWKHMKKGWGDTDMACIKLYFEKVYKIFSPLKFKDALLAGVCCNRIYHPIKKYFDSLKWDKVERIDTLLIDYLGADDNEYVRTVTRKTLCAAVARIYEPGIKFDYILVLNGPQGIGKSTFFEILGKDWYSDSLTISDMKDKTAAEKLQGYWILELGELAGIRKMDVEIVKSFITRRDDKFRQAYGTTVQSHPRCSIVVGTTNADTGFLRDTTGNRRFWPVYVSGESELKPWDMEDVDQIWAEAIYRYKEGEKLYLRGKVEQDAIMAQNEAMEFDNRQGLIMEYLEKPLPANWDEYDLYKRRNYLNDEDFVFGEDEELVKRDNVCVMEIWCECFQRERADLKKSDSREIEGILIKIGGWQRLSTTKTGKKRYALYGPQKAFIRKE